MLEYPHDSKLYRGFSALQRAEIAEILVVRLGYYRDCNSFSALQRAEIAEIFVNANSDDFTFCFSALQRAEIAEMVFPTVAT